MTETTGTRPAQMENSEPDHNSDRDRLLKPGERLWRDWAFRATATVVVLVAIPFIFPVFNENFAWYWREYYADPLIYAAALIAVTVGIARTRSRREKRFWQFVAFAVAAVTLDETLLSVATDNMWNNVWELVTQTVYLVYYLGMALALEASRSHIEDEGARTLHWLRTVNIGVLLIALLVYFEIIPITLAHDENITWAPALLIYVVLDSVLCAGFLHTRRSVTDPRWKSILGGMAIVMALFALVDLAESLFYLEPFLSLELNPVWDLPWFVPVAALILVARYHHSAPRTGAEPVIAVRTTVFTGGPLIAYTLFLPVVSTVLQSLGLVDPRLHDQRELLVTVTLVVMGALTLIYQRRVERENNAAHRGLRLGKERYESFIRSSGEGIYLGEMSEPIPVDSPVDEQIQMLYERMRITEANDAMAHMYGLADASELIGKTMGKLHGGVDDPTNIAMLRRLVEENYSSQRVPSAERDVHGNEVFFENSTVGIVEEGFLLRLWGTQVDVTEQHRAAAEKDRLEVELRQSQRMETIGTLAGGIAHDFNNILAPIVGFTELATELASEKQPKVAEYLNHVSKAAKRAQALVSQILSASQNREGARQAVLIQDIVAEAINLLRQTIPSTIEIYSRVEPECPPVHADPAQLHQVLMNLVTNAYHAIGDGGGRITVELEYVSRTASSNLGLGPTNHVVLTVSDDGPGIDPAVISRVFDPFFTTKEVGKGTGLGLSVVHGIVLAHGGDVRLESQPGNGACFKIYLPATDVSATSKESTVVEAQGGRARIMLVDDENEVAAVAQVMLTRLGYSVDVFTDPRNALAALQQRPGGYDVLVTDQTMPHITGPQLAQQARALNDRLGVVIASGYRLAESANVDDHFQYLDKPFSSNRLAAAVKHSLTNPEYP